MADCKQPQQEISDELLNRLKFIYGEFIEQANLIRNRGTPSNPQWVAHYNFMVEYWDRGIAICVEFFEKRDLLQLVTNLITCGFSCEAFYLKKYVHRNQHQVLKKIEEAEKEQEEYNAFLADKEHKEFSDFVAAKEREEFDTSSSKEFDTSSSEDW